MAYRYSEPMYSSEPTKENTMNATEARAIFNQAIANTTDPDRLAKLELLREYFTNDEFRAALENHVWELSQNCCGDAACYNMGSGVPCAAFRNNQ